MQLFVAGPCAMIADGRVFPVREVVFDLLQPGELRAAEGELRFGAVDGLQAVGFELCHAEGVELFVDLLFPFLEALPFGKAFFEALFQRLVYAVVFDVGSGEGFKGVKGCGFAFACADDGDFYTRAGGRPGLVDTGKLSIEVNVRVYFGFGFEAFAGEFVEFGCAVGLCSGQLFEQGLAEGVDERFVRLRVEDFLFLSRYDFFFSSS